MSGARKPMVGDMVLFWTVADNPTREVPVPALIAATPETDPLLSDKVHLIAFPVWRSEPRYIYQVRQAPGEVGCWSFREPDPTIQGWIERIVEILANNNIMPPTTSIEETHS